MYDTTRLILQANFLFKTGGKLFMAQDRVRREKLESPTFCCTLPNEIFRIMCSKRTSRVYEKKNSESSLSPPCITIWSSYVVQKIGYFMCRGYDVSMWEMFTNVKSFPTNLVSSYFWSTKIVFSYFGSQYLQVLEKKTLFFFTYKIGTILSSNIH